jgi:hypothetical protein
MPVRHRNTLPALLLLATAACVRAPLDLGPEGEAKSPEELLRRIALTEATILQVKGEGKLMLQTPQGRGAATVFAAALHPAYVHLEQLDFFGRPHAVLTSDGDTFGLFDVQAGEFFRGPASAENLARFFPIALPPRELAALLLGRVPRIAAESMELRFDDRARTYVLVLRRAGVTQTLHVAPPHYRVIKSSVVGAPAYDLEAGDVEPFGGVTFAKHLTLSAAQTQTAIDLRWTELVVNETIDLTIFDGTPPENVPVVDLDALGRPRGPPAKGP